MASWKPIDTAPKDGTQILVCGLSHKRQYHDIISWQGEWCSFHPEDDAFTMPVMPPTHWMPLPEAPQLETNSAIPKPLTST